MGLLMGWLTVVALEQSFKATEDRDKHRHY